VNQRIKDYLLSCLASLVIVNAIIIWSELGPSVPDFSILLAPGMLLAAVAFREGVHSDSPSLYLILAMSLDVLLHGALVWCVWRMFARRRRG
jgi:hypothetical protein